MMDPFAHSFRTRVISAMSLGLAVLLAVPAAADSADAAGSTLGIAQEKAAEGPSVKVDGGYMVPYTATIPGTDIQFEMIPVPGGTFKMGSPEDEADRGDDEGPQVQVTVDPMWVAKTEVTWEQYKEYMRMYTIFKDFESRGERVVNESNQADAITAPTQLYDSTFTYEYGEDPQQPAVTMTPYAAKQFTKWLSRITGEQYRLPTEAEWEYAARGGTDTAYSWGDDPEQMDDYAWYFDNALDGPGFVATKKPNPFGLYDMHGNAAEWTVNEYTEDGYEAWASKDGLHAVDAVQWPKAAWPRVARGGSWEMDPENLRSAARLASDNELWKGEDPNFPRSPWWFTSDPSRGVGFRLFRSHPPLSEEKITKFWEASDPETRADVESRIVGGRGGWGLVDEMLPEAIKALEDE